MSMCMRAQMLHKVLSDLLELEFQAIVSCFIWVMETKTGSSSVADK